MQTTLLTIAQQGAIESISGLVLGVILAAVAGLLSLAVAAGSAVMIWRLLGAMLKDPDPTKLIGIVGGLLLAVYLIGATPALVAMAYDAGRGLVVAGA